ASGRRRGGRWRRECVRRRGTKFVRPGRRSLYQVLGEVISASFTGGGRLSPDLLQRRNSIRTVVIPPSTRKMRVVARKIRPYGPRMRTAAAIGGIGGIDSFTAHAAAAPAIAAVPNFATELTGSPLLPTRAFL